MSNGPADWDERRVRIMCRERRFQVSVLILNAVVLVIYLARRSGLIILMPASVAVVVIGAIFVQTRAIRWWRKDLERRSHSSV